MKRALNKDLKRLSKMAFGRLKHCGPLLKRFHSLKPQIGKTGRAQLMWRLYDWLLAPFMLWPHDFEGLAKEMLGKLENEEKLDETFWLLLESIEEPPAAKTQEVIAEFERDVESGRYEKMLKQRSKYDEAERALLENDELLEAWRKIKGKFDVTKFQNARGVIRRRVSGERNFREGWKFDWSNERGQFHEIFDAMCYKWNLYGMEKDKPLLMKVSVNPTPHGTLIFVPRHLSFDPYRDLDWKLISRLHRARGASKQGPKLSSARNETIAEAKRAKELWEEAGENGKKGDARYEYVRERMGRDPRADQGWLWRLLRKSQGPKASTQTTDKH